MKAYGKALMAVMASLFAASPVFAQATGTTISLGGAPIGAGLIMIGAALGFGKIGAAALEGMARQPEVAGKIQPAMILVAALLEGATFFALLICIIKG